MLTQWRRIPGPPHDELKARLLRLHRALRARLGAPGLRPGRTPFQIAAGAILARHTERMGAARAIAALRAAGARSAAAVDRMPLPRLAAVLRPAGTPRVKVRCLKAFTRWLVARHGGRFEHLRRAPLPALRAELLRVPGLGAEAADAILLHAARRPVFVADAGVRRALDRHRLLSAGASYEQARSFLEAHLPSDPALFSEFHALLTSEGGSAPHPHRRGLRPLRATPVARTRLTRRRR